MRGAYRGCKEPMPYFEARRPVAKGSAADPAMPRPATSPTHPVSSQWGRIRVIWDTSSGNIGPSTTPIRDTCESSSVSVHA